MLELTTEFSGDNMPAKRVEVARTEDLETQAVSTTTTPTYYLHASALGGQTVAEFNAQGSMTAAHIYAGGTRIASEDMNTFINHYRIDWQDTDPVTGSWTMQGYLQDWWGQAELEPLGQDVRTPPPDPGTFLGEPAYLNSLRTAFWPIEYTGGETGEAAFGMAQFEAMVARVTAIARENEADKKAAMAAWAKGDRKAWEQILHRNPNVGIVVTDSNGSRTLWGGEAADLLTGQAGKGDREFEVLGKESPPQNSSVSPGDLRIYRDRIGGMLNDKKCSGFLDQLLNEAKTQTGRPYEGILATFDRIKFYWGNTGPTHGGSASFEHGVPVATISDTINTDKMGGSLANQRDRHGFLIRQTTQDFLGETLHHVGKGTYSDGEMAAAMNAMLVSQGRDTHKDFSDKTMTDIENASRYWHPKVEIVCPAPRR